MRKRLSLRLFVFHAFTAQLDVQDLALFDLSGASGAYTGVIDLMERHVNRAWQPPTEIINTVETMSTSQSGESETVIATFT
ncbi:MAG: hypothetical protein OTJ45_07770, partial [Alphaproteobacteria bacterium]|nr:hypothetical protein [Alphaproteobacteria bacterium]